jgi:hypothetical protein
MYHAAAVRKKTSQLRFWEMQALAKLPLVIKNLSTSEPTCWLCPWIVVLRQAKIFSIFPTLEGLRNGLQENFNFDVLSSLFLHFPLPSSLLTTLLVTMDVMKKNTRYTYMYNKSWNVGRYCEATGYSFT